MGRVTEAIRTLESQEGSLSGDALESLLVGLGFRVKATKSGRHQVVTHPELSEFRSASFDKGHGKHVLPCYCRDMRNLLKRYRVELEAHLGEAND